jgi:predicted Fe-S protein YdhL (DUF1289 family)
MGFFITTYKRPVVTPCIGVCTLRDDGLCEGCLRTGDEIASWGSLPDSERQRVMYDVLPERRRREEGR